MAIYTLYMQRWREEIAIVEVDARGKGEALEIGRKIIDDPDTPWDVGSGVVDAEILKITNGGDGKKTVWS